jgi:hypothetical protein
MICEQNASSTSLALALPFVNVDHTTKSATRSSRSTATFTLKACCASWLNRCW